MVGEKQIQTLVELGLTQLQARVYFALVCLGTATAKEARDYSKLARQDIYRVAKELHELGLIQKIISRPTRYRAIPLREATSILFNNKKKDISKLRAKAEELNKFQKTSIPNTLEWVHPTFTLIPQTKKPLKLAAKAILKAQESVDAIATDMRLFYVITNYPECFEQAIQKGVKTRHIIAKPKDPKTIKHLEDFSAKSPHFEIRYIPKITPKIAIIDEKEVHIVIAPKEGGLEEDCVLYSDSTELIEIVRNYFESLWSQAKEVHIQ
ncbi:MAG: hypothetical protein NWF06_06015 [Candidatus Bathyarchaeota archaeon]|nr:hypothetical protein [Candidatus Bathyarchaeum sp.]